MQIAIVLALAAFAATLLEVLPPLGRYLPGQLFLAGIALYAAANDAATPWIVVAAFAGALAGDLANYAYARRHPRIEFGGSSHWWLPGHTLDKLDRGLKHGLLQTALRSFFHTRDRAVLPIAAGAHGTPPAKYVPVATLAVAGWTIAWCGIGLILGEAWQRLPDVARLGAVVVAMMIAANPLRFTTGAASTDVDVQE